MYKLDMEWLYYSISLDYPEIFRYMERVPYQSILASTLLRALVSGCVIAMQINGIRFCSVHYHKVENISMQRIEKKKQELGAKGGLQRKRSLERPTIAKGENAAARRRYRKEGIEAFSY